MTEQEDREETGAIDVIVSNPQQWERAVVATRDLFKRLLGRANGKDVLMHLLFRRITKSEQQRRFYWGVVVRQVSEQASIFSVRYATDAWHELFKRQHLGYEIVVAQVAGRKRKTTYRRLRSTTELNVKEFSLYLEKVIAYAADELGVRFTETRWQDYRG